MHALPSLPAKTTATPPWLDAPRDRPPLPTPPILSRRKRLRLAPCFAELWALLQILHPLPHEEPLAPELLHRAHNAIIRADRIIATLPIDPPPPLAGISNSDFGVGILVRLIGVSRYVKAEHKRAVRTNIEAGPRRYKIYPRRSGAA